MLCVMVQLQITKTFLYKATSSCLEALCKMLRERFLTFSVDPEKKVYMLF